MNALTQGQKLKRLINLDKRKNQEIADLLGISKVSLNKWTKLEYIHPKNAAKLKAIGIDITTPEDNGELHKAMDIRLAKGRFVKVIFPDDITNAEVDKVIKAINLWKL